MRKVVHTGISVVLFVLIGVQLFAADERVGSIIGEVRSAETKTPLVGTNVMLAGTNLGAATDEQGRFLITGVPVGSYTIVAQYIGYQTVRITDVIVKSNRRTQVNIEMQVSPVSSEEVTVTAGYFSKELSEPASVTGFSSEEIRRAPGSGGDVSRILMSLPSVAKVNDQSNRLIVRGGNPMENTFFIDNIEVPNINHFKDMAS